MARLVFSELARQDMDEAAEYMSGQLQNKKAAGQFLLKVEQTVQQLEMFPNVGTRLEYGNEEYRYLVCQNYLIFYRTQEKIVYIDRVLYGKRNYMTLLFGGQMD